MYDSIIASLIYDILTIFRQIYTNIVSINLLLLWLSFHQFINSSYILHSTNYILLINRQNIVLTLSTYIIKECYVAILVSDNK